MATTEHPTTSEHATDRWLSYTTDGAFLPEDYWSTAIELSDHGCHGEARYVPEHNVVLVRKDHVITTVINVEPAMRTATRRAIERATGSDPISEPDE